MNLSREELIRYSRQLSLKDFGIESQLKLKKSRVLVVGAGGLGCPALLYLSAAGIGNIGILDFDTVALHNLQRQVLYVEDDIGKPKALVAANHLQKRNSAVNFDSIRKKINHETAKELISDYDIVLDCTDNFEARYAINDACVMLNKPFVYGALFRFEGQVSLFNAKEATGKNGPTYRCLFPEQPPEETALSCEDAGILGFLPGIVGSMQAGEAIKWIIGLNGLSGKLFSINTRDYSVNVFEVERKESLWKENISTKFTLA